MPERTSSDDGLTGAYSGTSVTWQIIIAYFLGLAMYNVVEFQILVFGTFTRYRGTYFWSLVISSQGIFWYSIRFLFKYFGVFVGNAKWVSVVWLTIGWYSMVTGQAFVLWSRLHLLVTGKRGEKIIKYTRWMIITDVFLFHFPTTVFTFGANADIPTMVHGYNIMEKIQMGGFFIQEVILSSVYIIEVIQILQTSLQPNTRRLMKQLITINVIIILFDMGLVGIECANLYMLQKTAKAAFYSIKVKLESAILSKLVHFVGRGSTHRQAAPRFRIPISFSSISGEPQVLRDTPTACTTDQMQTMMSSNDEKDRFGASHLPGVGASDKKVFERPLVRPEARFQHNSLSPTLLQYIQKPAFTNPFTHHTSSEPYLNNASIPRARMTMPHTNPTTDIDAITPVDLPASSIIPVVVLNDEPPPPSPETSQTTFKSTRRLSSPHRRRYRPFLGISISNNASPRASMDSSSSQPRRRSGLLSGPSSPLSNSDSYYEKRRSRRESRVDKENADDEDITSFVDFSRACTDYSYAVPTPLRRGSTSTSNVDLYRSQTNQRGRLDSGGSLPIPIRPRFTEIDLELARLDDIQIFIEEEGQSLHNLALVDSDEKTVQGDEKNEQGDEEEGRGGGGNDQDVNSEEIVVGNEKQVEKQPQSLAVIP